MSVVLLDNWANDGSVDNLFTHGMILVIWEFGVILGNDYGF